MISPKLYKNSRVYDFCLKSLGFERSVDRFLSRLTLPLKEDCRILDAGCGTGLMGLHFLERHKKSTLHATDLEPNFLDATLENAKTRGIDADRITVGKADISHPSKIELLCGTDLVLKAASFDLICVGAVIGYSSDTAATLRSLVELLAPGGRLLNLEMNEGLLGKYVSRRYCYNNIPINEIKNVMTKAGCQVTETRLKVSQVPAKFTRTALIAEKT